MRVIMTRDLTLFPEDEIGNTLWQMHTNDDDLTHEREIEFAVLFASQSLALQFGKLLLENNQKLSLTSANTNPAMPWEITAYPLMSATYENISDYRDLLVSSSTQFEGVFDGVYFIN
jgi:hypothetical protein